MAALKLLLCLLSLTASNISCVAFVSFSLATLPTKRNLFTYFDRVLVLALTSVVDIAVRITLFLAAPKNAIASSQFLPKLFCHLSSILLCYYLLLFSRVTFSLSVYCCLMLPSLWTPTAPCGCSIELHFGVDSQPCSVLLHQPQRHQDVPAVQGEHTVI